MIFIVDDDKNIREAVRDVLEDEDLSVETFASGRKMLKELPLVRPDLIILDVWMGKEDGLEILDRIKAEYPALPVLMISGHATIEQAVAATKKGAVDFLEKPLSIDAILDKVRLILLPEGREEYTELEFDNIIGSSAPIKKIKHSIAQAARTNARVLIYGENGTGKELVARAIFANSHRRDKPFVEVNCAAIPSELIESELFGHEKGAFTGATERRSGKFEQAHTGTLFLDELSDMSLATQASVLRALQEQRFTRVGGSEIIEVDVRIIAATNMEPQKAIQMGRFREDLYYRLNVIPINMPPLRDRKEDIPLLAEHFIKEAVRDNALAERRISPEALSVLSRHNWPGNIRELKNMMERLSIMSEADTIDALMVQEQLGRTAEVRTQSDLKQAREEFEKKHILEVLKQNDYNISRSAKALGLERAHLHRKMKQLGLARQTGDD
ncbi:MAG: sigma-54-dependent Fis family transcriptional regulator [Spirochaetales bacterium]|nr:sigma-54-dependent Fis family transcriptional regulator [Spirochaetales bacterium]